MDCCHYRDFVMTALRDLYLEPDSLVPRSDVLPTEVRSPRATERSIVGRFLIHAHQHVTTCFPPGSILDVEYERFGIATDAKTINHHKISPDLIVHRRGHPQTNYLAIEMKRFGHRRQRIAPAGPATEDYRKVHYLTHCLEHHPRQPAGKARMSAYRLGLCMELDTAGATLWWVARPPRPYTCRPECEGWQPGQPVHTHWERWTPAMPAAPWRMPH
jgi:hypothetical protein